MAETTTLGDMLAAPLHVVAELAEEKADAKIRRELEKPLFEKFEIAGRTYMVDTTAKRATEVKPPKTEQLNFPKIGSLRGIAELVQRHGIPDNGAVVVGTEGIHAYLAISADEDQQRPDLLAPYFHGDDAPQGEMGVEALYLWLDRFHGAMGQSTVDPEQERAVWAAISSVKAVVADEYEVSSEGGSIEVTTKTKQGVTGKTHLPKYITVRQRLGVRDFQTERLYRLQVLLPGKTRDDLGFRLIPVDTDGAHERFVAWAVEGLDAMLNRSDAAARRLEEGITTRWIVCEGP